MADVEPELQALAGATTVVDPVEEKQALAQVEAGLFRQRFRPLRMGRYVLLERLGAGGGGVVYRGYDPELHRKVAIKLLRASTKLPSGRARMLREAQALARLSDPHVVAVYDVGVVTGEREHREGVFIVMEYVEGQPLDRWFRSRQRSWSQILDVMLDAGHGLAAVHRQGLVHRDFKPANVMVQPDGTARVVDFGLAGATKTSASASDSGSTPSESTTVLGFDEELEPLLVDRVLTATDTVVGTPPYMPPEQHDGRTLDARADVYAFCASLYQGLCGRLPFGKGELDALREAKRGGPPPIPPEAKVPRWLTEIVLRGLQADPDARFADMAALLTALERRRHFRRRWLVAGGAVLVLGSLAGLQALSPASDCPTEGRLRGVWDEELRKLGEASFASAARPYGAEAWASVAPGLDAYASSWLDEREAVCRSTASVDERGARALCLDQELARFGQMTRAFASADPNIVQNAAVMLQRLEPPARCREATSALRWQAGRRAGSTEAIIDRDRRLLRADVLRQAGKYDDAIELATAIFAEASASKDPLGGARAALLACRAGVSTDRVREADTHCRQALRAAELSKDDVLVIDTLITSAFAASHRHRFDEAERLLEVAEARLQALEQSQSQTRLEAQLLRVRGSIRTARFRDDEAVEPLEAALALYAEAYGTEHPDTVSVLNGLAIAMAGQDRLEAALEYYERALVLAHRLYGRRHPMVAALENNLAGTYLDMGRLPEALDHIELALSIKEETLGAESPRLVTTLTRLGRVLMAFSRADEALPHFERALVLQQVESGPDGPATAETHLALALALGRTDRCPEALDHLETAARIRGRAPESLPALAWEVPLERARCELVLDRIEPARASLQDAVEHLRARRDTQPRRLTIAVRELARWHRDHGEPTTAITLMREALELSRASQGDPRVSASSAFELAQMLAPTSRDEAVDLARLAVRTLQPLPWAADDLAQIEAWLKEQT